MVLTHNHSIGTICIFAHWLIMVRSRNWPDLWSQILKIRDIQVVGIHDIMWPLRSLKVRNPFFTLTWPVDLTFGDLGLKFVHKMRKGWMNSYAKFGGAARRHFPAICEKPMGEGTYMCPPPPPPRPCADSVVLADHGYRGDGGQL